MAITSAILQTNQIELLIMKKSHKIIIGCAVTPFLVIGVIVVITIFCFALSNDKIEHIDNARIVFYVDNDKKPHDGELEYIAIIDENTVYIKDNGKESLTSVKSISDVHDGVMAISLKDGSLVMLSQSVLGYVLGYNEKGETELYIIDKDKSKLPK